MSKASRMINLLMHLQARNMIKAQELAEILETNQKTIYRDIETLRTAQIPIESKPGRYGGYYIPKNFYLKVPGLTSDEVGVLFFAGEILTKKNGFMLEKNFKSALSKIKNSLASEEIKIASGKVSSISYEIDSMKTKIWENAFYIVEKSISQKKSVKVKYYTLSRNEIKTRILDPYHLIYKSGAWYLVAYCHWRRDIKTFRVDRIQYIQETDMKFKFSKDFSLKEYLKNSWHITRGENFKVKVRFFPPAARYVKEMKWLPTQKITEENNGNIIFSAQISGLLEIKQWILSYGSQAEVLQPKSLRNEIISEIKSISKRYELGTTVGHKIPQ